MKIAFLRNSLRIRLLAGTLVWIVISILVAGWGLGQLFHQHVEAQFDVELKNHLDQLTAQLILDEQNQAQVRLLPSDPRLNKPLSGLYWQIDRIAAAGEHPSRLCCVPAHCGMRRWPCRPMPRRTEKFISIGLKAPRGLL
jgi:hypothetical protein